MSWMGGWFDPELEDLFHDDPELLETARQVRAARPRSEPDPRFQNRLRAQLVAEASRGFSARGVRRWWRLGPTHFAWGGAVVGAALITATVFTFVSNHAPDQTVTAFSQLSAQHSVSPNQVITVAFNQPMDEHAVEARGPDPAGDQGDVLLEGQQPGDLARVSPLREYPIHGDHRPDRHPRVLGRVGGGTDQHHLRDCADADSRPRGPAVAQSRGGRFERNRRLAALRAGRLTGQHRRSASSVGDNLPEPNRDRCRGNPDGEPDADTRGHDHADSRGTGIARRIPPLRSSNPARTASSQRGGILAQRRSLPRKRGG